MDRNLPLRITIVQPPRNVAFALQRGKDELLPPAAEADGQISFDFSVRVGVRPSDGAPNFLGPFTQGPPAGRFVYVNVGTSAGQADSPWTRRAKVPLAGIDWPIIDEALATPGAVVEARFAGTAKDGSPACATVPLLDGGWKVKLVDEATIKK